MTETKLLPCPFCGGEACVVNALEKRAQAICKTCRASTAYHFTEAEAIEAWNTRHEKTCYYVPDQSGFTWWDENDEEHEEEYSADYECWSASCSECGYTMIVGDDGWFDGWDEITEWTEEDGSRHKGYVLIPRFKYCPDCGARVVSTCKNCRHGQFRGYPPKDAPEWEVGTVSFWCPVHRHHDAESISCTQFEPGGARRFDKNGDEL